MPKKKSIEPKPTEVEEATFIAKQQKKEKPKKKKKPSNEIDEIFAGKKRKKPDQEKNGNGDEKAKSSEKKTKKKSREDREGRFTDPPVKSRKKTEDGFNIYAEDELGINSSNGGGTPLCPFDCECCF